MRWKKMAGIGFLCACTASAVAQGSMAPAAKAGMTAATMMEPAKAVDSQISGIESQMMGVVKAMPADKFNFAPAPDKFASGQTVKFDKVRTFAEQAKHVAQANYFFFALVSGLKPEADVAAIGKLTGKDEIVAALASSFAFGHKAAATLTAANAFEMVKIDEPGVYTRSTLATFSVAHAYDHYGQMVEYLRMNGLAPPASM